MPRNRNRTVTSNFEFPPEFLKTLPYPEEISVNGQKASKSNAAQLCFGEPIPLHEDSDTHSKCHNSASSSDCNNAASGLSDIEIISFGKSSSSSISWSDEFDSEATQHVQNEFVRMERVLQGKEAIPAHYNRGEYEQWIKTFPQLSVTSIQMISPVRHKPPNKSQIDNYEEIFAYDSNESYLIGDCDREPTSSEMKIINDVKRTVIDQVFQNVSSKLLSRKHISKANNSTKNDKLLEQRVEKSNTNDGNTHNLQTQFDSFLRISPVLLQESTNRSNYLDTRQHSSHSVSRSDKLASKWMKEDAVEYSSLPYLSPVSAKNKSRKTVRHKNPTTTKSRYYSSKLSTNRNNYISLPPIQTLSVPSADQYRSISATPRKPSKGSSAASVQVDSLLAKSRSGFEVTSYLNQNNLDARTNLLKQNK